MDWNQSTLLRLNDCAIFSYHNYWLQVKSDLNFILFSKR